MPFAGTAGPVPAAAVTSRMGRTMTRRRASLADFTNRETPRLLPADSAQESGGESPHSEHLAAPEAGESPPLESVVEALVFIKGSNNLPNTLGTVEQADRWRETYVVTDEGPVYRPGDNLYLLKPPRPDGQVVPVTHVYRRLRGRAGVVVGWQPRHLLAAQGRTIRGGKFGESRSMARSQPS